MPYYHSKAVPSSVGRKPRKLVPEKYITSPGFLTHIFVSLLFFLFLFTPKRTFTTYIKIHNAPQAATKMC